jgi:acetolactate synthase-1/2/3 large subunit
MRIYEAVAHALAEEGVDTIFGLMGDGNLRLLNYWTAGMEQAYYGTRHEAQAVSMADGYARVSGRVGVCTVTQGPGVTNTITALINARKARTPVVVLMGDVASFQTGWPQDVDHSALLAAAGVPIVRIQDPTSAFSDVVRALRLARDSRGPVGINLPTDVQEQEWAAFDDDTAVPEFAVESSHFPAEEIQQAAALLLEARRPVVIAGRGAVESDCGAALTEIGDRVGALLATTLRGKGTFGRHEYVIGTAGGLGSNLAVQLIGEADVVLVVGASMNDFTAMRGQLISPTASVIRCELDPERASNLPQTRMAFVGDAAAFVAALAAELERRGETSPGFRPRAKDQMVSFDPRTEFNAVREPGALDPRELCIRLDAALPQDRVVVTDAGHFFGYPVAYISVPDGRSFVCGIDFGSIGLGIGLAMGAAIARPDRPTVMFVGDGGMLMSLGDLDTVARYQIPLSIIVMNDAAYGSELQILRLWDLSTELSVFPPNDFRAVSESLGIASFSVRSEADLEAAVAGIEWGSAPVLVDCTITQNVCAAWLEEAFRH